MSACWDRSFRAALERAAWSGRTADGGAMTWLSADGQWSTEGLRAAARALKAELAAARKAMSDVGGAFGGRFSSGREERLEPMEHLAAIRAFVPQLEGAMHAAQRLPSLLRLARASAGGEGGARPTGTRLRWSIASARASATDEAKWRAAIAPSPADRKGQRRKRAYARALFSAWPRPESVEEVSEGDRYSSAEYM